MKYKSKYLGVLTGYNFGKLIFDEKNLQILIENKIIVPIENIDKNQPSSNWLFGEKAGYTISSDFLEDVFAFIKSYVESLSNNAVFWCINDIYISFNFLDIQNALHVTLDIEEKISILKKQYKNLNSCSLGFKLSEVNNNLYEYKKKINPRGTSNYPIRRLYNYYLGKNENDFNKWKEWVFERFSTNIFLKKFLSFEKDVLIDSGDEIEFFFRTNDFKYADFDLISIWSNFIVVERINNYIIKNLERIEREITTPLPQKSDLRKQLYSSEKQNLVEFKKITLLNLFRSETDFVDFEKKLKSKSIIDKDFKIIKQLDCLDRKLLCGIGYLLVNKNYLVSKKDKPEYYKGDNLMAKVLVSALNNTFSGVHITEANYSGHKKKRSISIKKIFI